MASGSLVYLVSKGAQDVYINESLPDSIGISRYSRFKNFSEFPQRITFNNDVKNNSTTFIKLSRTGDLISHIWLEGTNLIDYLSGAEFELRIGGQQIDCQTFDYMADIWQIYMAENSSKSNSINNLVSKTNKNFFPLHFFFCDNDMFLPLIALQYYEVEITIKWPSNIESVTNLKMYGNYVLLDNIERNYLSKNRLEFLITQVQSLPFTSENILNLRTFNHPVKAIFFGFESGDALLASDTWTFDSASLSLNETYLFEEMSPTFFHTVQGYYYTEHGVLNFDTNYNTPIYTRYYMYSFGNKVNTYNVSGTCNFSRIDKCRLFLTNTLNRTSKNLKVYAVNYNILRIENGMGGLLFSN